MTATDEINSQKSTGSFKNGESLSVCFTGHRIITEYERTKLPRIIKDAIRSLYFRGARDFYAGGAMGFDTLASLCVIELKSELPELRLHLILPHENQEDRWNYVSKKAYYFVKSCADSERTLSEKYYSGCMQARNRELVDLSDVCVAYFSSKKGGTSYTCAYALKSGLEFINVYDIMMKKSPDII